MKKKEKNIRRKNMRREEKKQAKKKEKINKFCKIRTFKSVHQGKTC